MRPSRVAVVGAGIAGLATARRLARESIEVVVFEKARGVGGRASTRRLESEAFDHGAQYFTCRSEPFRRQVEDWCRRDVAAVWNVPIRTLHRGECGKTREQEHRYVGVPGMSALARDLSVGLRVECGRRVERIEGSPRSWHLVAEQGPAFPDFDAVVVATPAPQAVPLLAAAPRLAELARGVEMLPCHALMVTFRESLDVDFGGAFVSEPPLAWVARNASKPGRPAAESWVLHADSAWSASHLDDSAETVAKSLLEAFGVALGRSLPANDSLVTHLWRFSRTERPLDDASSWDADASLGICGDWTHGDRIEGAFTSGEALARSILQHEPRPAREHASPSAP